jgi:DNA-binding transcriptional MerR regulator
VSIPDREQFKGAEVCELAGVQPYVLRSWELEFPSIGTSRSPGSPRVYRRADVERILRIKGLVFSEGLTLAGARRRLEEEDAAASPPEPVPAADPEAREKLGRIKEGLRALLAMLGDAPPKRHAAWPPPRMGVLEFGGADERATVSSGNAKRAPRKRSAKS